MTAIKIADLHHHYLTVEVRDVLPCVRDGESYHWTILFFEGVGDVTILGTDVLEIEHIARESPDGWPVTWPQLIQLSEHLEQCIDLMLVGCLEPMEKLGSKSDEYLYETCDIVFELVDSSYWIVHSHSNDLIECLKGRFENVTMYDGR
jgi:hypothetical protein